MFEELADCAGVALAKIRGQLTCMCIAQALSIGTVLILYGFSAIMINPCTMNELPSSLQDAFTNLNAGCKGLQVAALVIMVSVALLRESRDLPANSNSDLELGAPEAARFC